MILGGIEAGGTKMVCAVSDETGKILDKISLPTLQPEETIPQMIAYFEKWGIEALGIGSFGPVDMNRNSPTYGYITKTPKLGWEHYDMRGTFARALNCPVGFDTDVNAAILGEVTWGAASGCDSAIYVTVGTGVGVGVYVNGALLHGLVHPEGGHMLLARHPDDTYEGYCMFHPDCVESLASGPAIEGRWGKKAYELTDRSEVWELEAYYLIQAVTNYVCAYSPQKIILWGGVMHQEQLFELVRCGVREKLNGYVQHEAVNAQIDTYIVPPALGENPGILGAIRLGMLEHEYCQNGCNNDDSMLR